MKELVKKIRDSTGAGFLECKKAAEESNGNFDVAIEILKAKGIERASKKMENDVEHGSVVIKCNDAGSMVVLSFKSQTDFAVKSAAFCNFINTEADIWLSSNENSIELTKNEQGESFQDRLHFFISTLGENVVLKKSFKFEAEDNMKYVSYLHNKINENFSNVALLGVVLKFNKEANDEICLNIAKHVAATDSLILSSDLITEEMIKENPKIKEFVLLDQKYFYDESLTIKDLIENHKIKIADFHVFIA